MILFLVTFCLWLFLFRTSNKAPKPIAPYCTNLPTTHIGLAVVEGMQADELTDYLQTGGEARKGYVAALYERMRVEEVRKTQEIIERAEARTDRLRAPAAPVFAPELDYDEAYEEDEVEAVEAPTRTMSPNVQVAVGPIHLTAAAPVPTPPAPLDEHPMRHAIYFKQGEPQTFAEYGSQGQVIQQLLYEIGALDPDESAFHAPNMLLGPAGMGKTLLARVVANELDYRALTLGLPPVRFLEVIGTELNDRSRLDGILRECEANPGCVLFIDETHGVAGQTAQLLLPLLDEHRYGYLNEAPRRLVPFTILGATTNFGDLPAPLRRRWIQHQLSTLSAQELSVVLQRRAVALKRTLGAPARKLIVDRVAVSGAPWEAVRVLGLAHNVAKTKGLPEILPEHVREVFDMIGMDTQGLDRIDRSCLQALFRSPQPAPRGAPGVIYKAAEGAVIAMAGVDPEYYRSIVKPKLMSRGFLMIRGGQQITEKGVAEYAALLA